MVITTNPITTDKITIKGTLPRISTFLKLGYLKFDTMSNPAEAVTNAPATDNRATAEYPALTTLAQRLRLPPQGLEVL